MADNVIPLEPARAELLALAGRLAPADGVHATPLPGLYVARASTPATLTPAVYEPGIALVLQGRKCATLGREVLQYDPLHYLLVSVTMMPLAQIIEASPAEPFLSLRLDVDAGELGELMLQAPPPPHVPAVPARGLRLSRVDRPLLDAMLRLARLAEAPHDAAVLAPLARREIFWRVLNGELGARLREMALVDSHAHRIGRVVEELKRRYAEPLRVEELAALAFMSPSTLHLRFKQLTSLSPLQYQKQMRLHHARRLMLSEGVDATTAAHRVGYESPSQFSREYRRFFGMPPRTEVQGLRDAVARLG